MGGGFNEDLLDVSIVAVREEVFLEVGHLVCGEAAQVGVTQEDPPLVDSQAWL